MPTIASNIENLSDAVRLLEDGSEVLEAFVLRTARTWSASGCRMHLCIRLNPPIHRDQPISREVLIGTATKDARVCIEAIGAIR
jgi:hypothetical protein